MLVDGNDLVVKMEDGTIRHFPNVPESARVTVDGKELGIHDLKPGMRPPAKHHHRRATPLDYHDRPDRHREGVARHAA